MEFKPLALLLLSATFVSSSSIQRGDASVFAQDFGPTIADAIKNIVAGLDDPLVLFQGPEPIKINLTELTASSSVKIKGNLDISSLSIAGISGLTVDRASAILNGIMQPFPFDIAVSDPKIVVEADYSMDATISGLIPVRGAGLLTVTIDSLGFGVAGKITNLFAKLKLGEFDFNLAIKSTKVHLDGLLGDPGLSDVVSEVITQVVTSQFIDPIKDNTSDIHLSVVTLAKELFEGLELTLAALLDLLKPKPIATTVDSISL